jgi:hypothetical protein
MATELERYHEGLKVLAALALCCFPRVGGPPPPTDVGRGRPLHPSDVDCAVAMSVLADSWGGTGELDF